VRILCIDCEGPITLNDNAFEICKNFLPEGENFFKVISSFDDYLADVVKKKNYVAGTTLKLITPFLKAMGLTNKKIKEYSKKSIRFVPGAEEMMEALKSQMKVFIVSTSYTPYIQALCEIIDFPLKNTFSTSLDLDEDNLSRDERKTMIDLYKEIKGIFLPPPAGRKNISLEIKKKIHNLERIFFEKIPSMDCGKIMEKVNPVGGEEKKKAVEKSLSKVKANPEDVIYVGDSITDAEALKFVREKGGISLSFNGNIYALREAEFACISLHSFPLFLIIKEFNEKGRSIVSEIASAWPYFLKEEREKINHLAPESIFAKIREDNFSLLAEKSEKTRKKLRGEIIGTLG